MRRVVFLGDGELIDTMTSCSRSFLGKPMGVHTVLMGQQLITAYVER